MHDDAPARCLRRIPVLPAAVVVAPAIACVAATGEMNVFAPPPLPRRRRKIAEAGIDYEFPGFESSLPSRSKKIKFTEEGEKA